MEQQRKNDQRLDVGVTWEHESNDGGELESLEYGESFSSCSPNRKTAMSFADAMRRQRATTVGHECENRPKESEADCVSTIATSRASLHRLPYISSEPEKCLPQPDDSSSILELSEIRSMRRVRSMLEDDNPDMRTFVGDESARFAEQAVEGSHRNQKGCSEASLGKAPASAHENSTRRPNSSWDHDCINVAEEAHDLLEDSHRGQMCLHAREAAQPLHDLHGSTLINSTTSSSMSEPRVQQAPHAGEEDYVLQSLESFLYSAVEEGSLEEAAKNLTQMLHRQSSFIQPVESFLL